MVLTVGLLDVAVTQYGVGVVRAALEEGARAAARVGSGPAECETAAHAWLEDTFGGTRGEMVEVTCSATPTEVHALATMRWDAWLPGVPAWELEVATVRSRAPA